jgi:hypothetical protein
VWGRLWLVRDPLFIRLRSEPFSNQEIGYFFIALVLGLINGIDSGNIVYTLVLAIVPGGVFVR